MFSIRRKFLFAQLITLAILGLYDLYLGEQLSLYTRIWWYDIPAHILGGIWAAFFVLWLDEVFGRRISVSTCVLAVLAIGVGWEVYEYVIHTGGSPFSSYPVDTVKDLVDDIIGAAIAVYIARFARKGRNKRFFTDII